MNYYNDFDKDVCAWLRELIKHGLIPDGVVDDRSILDVEPADLEGFNQWHFFAGIGGWSVALDLCGMGDTPGIMTGSPPCQPFSAAGAHKGKDDARHLAPKFIELVRTTRPGLLFGEQVASAAVFGKLSKKTKHGPASGPEWAWVDDLSDRLEAAHYTVGASDIPAAGVGAYHIRQRTFFVGVEHTKGVGWIERRTEPRRRGADAGCMPDGLGYTDQSAVRGVPGGDVGPKTESGNWEHTHNACRPSAGVYDGLADADGCGTDGVAGNDAETAGFSNEERWTEHRTDVSERSGDNNDRRGHVRGHGLYGNGTRSGATDNPWSTPDWLFSRDGKWRPVETGTFPLADGLPARVGLLRGYGNAICPQVAAKFIEGVMICLDHKWTS